MTTDPGTRGAAAKSRPNSAFLDAASGEPMDAIAREAYLAALDDGWADADRLYREGRRARMLLDAAREAVAEVLGARADETFFTTSGTAAIHQGVAALAHGRARAGRRIVTSAVEHSAVLFAAEFAAARLGSRSQTVPVSRAGRIDLGALRAALEPQGSAALDGTADSSAPPATPTSAALPEAARLRDSTPSGDHSRADATSPPVLPTAGASVALVCVQAGNHEVGTTQPLDEVWQLCEQYGVPLFVDACAALGRVAPPSHWSALCGSARKWGGPAGVGVLAVRKGVRFASVGPADERESGRVPGPVNVPAILAAAAALRARDAERDAVAARQRELVELIRARVPELVPDVQVVGDPEARLPHIVTFSCLYASGEALLTELDRRGFSVSSGSSCTASTLTPSHVLEAMGVLSHGNIRVSLPWRTGRAEVEQFLRVLPEVVAQVRAQAPGVDSARPASPGAPAETPSPTTPLAPSTPTAPPPVTSDSADRAGTHDSSEGPRAPHTPEPPRATPPVSLPTAAELGAALVLDTLGRACPIPVIELAKRIDAIAPGELVAVLADDPAARLDIPAWCGMRGQSYAGERPLTGRSGAAYLVRREH